MATYQNENLGWHAPAYSEAHLQDFLEHRTREQLSHLAGLVAAEQARRAREVIKQGIERQRREREQRLARQREKRVHASPKTLHHLVTGSSDATTADVERAIAAGADIDATDGDRRTALWRAAARGKTGTLRALLEHGADINKDVTKKASPLHEAVANNHTEAVRVLVDAGADVTAGEPPPLVLACRVSYDAIVRELVRGGAADTKRSEYKEPNAIDEAIIADDLALVKLLCDSGASSAKYANLLYAVNFRYYDMVEYLLAGGADMYWQGGSLHDIVPMMYALWQYWRYDSSRIPVDAQKVPDQRMAEILVAGGYDVDRLQGDDNYDEDHGERLVVWAAYRDCYNGRYGGPVGRRTACVDMLCGVLGADVNLRKNDSSDDYQYRMMSALDVACSYGHFGLVEKLVDTYGARVHETLDKVTHTNCDFGNCRRRITVDLMTPVQWLFYWDDRGGTESSPEERLLIFRFLVARGARVSFDDVLEFQMEEVAKRMKDIESSPVQEVRKRVKPIIELAAAQLEVARQQARARRAAVAQEILLFRSGRASFAEDSEDEDEDDSDGDASDGDDGDDTDDDDEARLRCGISLLARVSLKGAFGQGFARRVLDHAFDDGESPRARTVPWADHEVGSPCALERHHREAYEAAVGA